MMELLLGRLHPLIVHLPIGFLLMAFILELLSYSRRWKKIRRAVLPVLYSGIIAGIAAICSGYLLAEEGGQEEDLVFRHQLFAILTLVDAVLLALLMELGKAFSGKAVRMLLFIFMITGLSLAGHFGGMMTHGRDYLMTSADGPALEEKTGIPQTSAPANVLMYQDLVRPILEEKCYSCHSNRKQKGKLRLDSEMAIRQGGKHGSVLDGKSEMLLRISSSVEVEGHMPPREKDQLTSTEIELLTAWVKHGASFNAPADSIPSALVQDAIRLRSTQTSEDSSWLPDDADRAAMDESELNALRISGMQITPVAAGSPWLEVTSSGPEKWGDSHWQIWEKIMDRIVSARFSFSGITDDQLSVVARAPELRRLMCDHSGISDAGIRNLKSAGKLQRLNVSDTRITASGLDAIGSSPGLREVYALGCNLEATAVSSFQKKFPRVKLVSSDPKLPFLPTDTIEFR